MSEHFNELEQSRIMVLRGGSPAIHKLGNIGRDIDDLIVVHEESDNFYKGNFHEGFGFIDVKFAKVDVRPMTIDEVDKHNEQWFGINGRPLGRNSIDYNGHHVSFNPDRKLRFISATDSSGTPKDMGYYLTDVTFEEQSKTDIGQRMNVFAKDICYPIITTPVINIEMIFGHSEITMFVETSSGSLYEFQII